MAAHSNMATAGLVLALVPSAFAATGSSTSSSSNSSSLSSFISTLIPVAALAIVYFLIFLVLRKKSQRVYRPREYHEILRPE